MIYKRFHLGFLDLSCLYTFKTYVILLSSPFNFWIMFEEMVKFKWSGIESEAIKSRFDLFESKRFSDVTLVTEDQVQFDAHRIILAGASRVFNNLLSLATERSAIVFLNGVKSTELRDILRYIYLGEVSVRESRNVREFQKIAKELQISLSTEEQQHLYEEKSIKQEIPKQNFVTKLDFLQSFPGHKIVIDSVDNNHKREQENRLTENESLERNDADSFSTTETDDFGLETLDEQAENEELKIQSIKEDISTEQLFVENYLPIKTIKKPRKSRGKSSKDAKRTCDEPAECEVCAKKFTTLRSMQRHYKTVHELLRYDCPQCGISCSGYDGLRHHINNKHKNIRYFCQRCDASFKASSTLRIHMKREHPLPTCDFHNLTFDTVEECDLHIQNEHINKNWDS